MVISVLSFSVVVKAPEDVDVNDDVVISEVVGTVVVGSDASFLGVGAVAAAYMKGAIGALAVAGTVGLICVVVDKVNASERPELTCILGSHRRGTLRERVIAARIALYTFWNIMCVWVLKMKARDACTWIYIYDSS